MILEIHASRIELSDAVRKQVERRIEFAIGRFRESVERVTVLLQDTNGPRGGDDKMCKIRVNLLGERQPLIAESTREYVRTSIDLAADSIGQSVARQLDRRRSSRRVNREVMQQLIAAD